MPQDNDFSPLFGHMQASPSGEKIPETVGETPVFPDKTSTILDTLSGTPDIPVSESVTAPVFPVSDLLPDEVHLDVTVPALTLDTLPLEDDLDRDIQLRVLTIPKEGQSGEAQTPPETMTHIDTITPTEIQKDTVIAALPAESRTLPQTDSKLKQYLQADTVYQQMIRVEDTEKIRLQLAIRYTLLMFAIFLVLAWIVSNRIIMFGFSEFVWLARIRDALFAVMAGLFALTLWFGSVSWTQNTTLIAVIRSLAVVFFGTVVVALYIPF